MHKLVPHRLAAVGVQLLYSPAISVLVWIQAQRVCTIRDSRGDDEMAACGQLGSLELTASIWCSMGHYVLQTRAVYILWSISHTFCRILYTRRILHLCCQFVCSHEWTCVQKLEKFVCATRRCRPADSSAFLLGLPCTARTQWMQQIMKDVMAVLLFQHSISSSSYPYTGLLFVHSDNRNKIGD